MKKNYEVFQREFQQLIERQLGEKGKVNIVNALEHTEVAVASIIISLVGNVRYEAGKSVASQDHLDDSLEIAKHFCQRVQGFIKNIEGHDLIVKDFR